jgi:hypothetical protein
LQQQFEQEKQDVRQSGQVGGVLGHACIVRGLLICGYHYTRHLIKDVNQILNKADYRGIGGETGI